MDPETIEALRRASRRGEGGAAPGRLSMADLTSVASRTGFSTRELSAAALENGILPLRYSRNIGTIGMDGQAKLLRSAAVVVGAGGIGGHAAELLARMGVGRLRLVDPDVFDESNLNRQNFACGVVLGMPKVDVVRDRLLEINPDVEVDARRAYAGKENLPGLLEGADVALDALDSLTDRLVLQAACERAGVVLVHGAIAGSALRATTVFPGDRGLEGFAGGHEVGGKDRGIEVETGNPATTPALAAAIQAEEAIKVILGREPGLRGRMLYLDTTDWSAEFIELPGS